MPPLAKLTAALLCTVSFAVAVAAASAADEPSNTFKGHGVSFTYPGSWTEVPATFEAQVGHALWTESVGPVPQAPPPDPSQPAPTSTPTTHPSLVTLAGYRVSVSITAKNLGRYKTAIAASVAQLAAQAHGQVESGPVRVSMGGLPGYRFQISATLSDGTAIQSRLVYVFRKRNEYFLNCQTPENDPLAAETEAGCDQVSQSFRLGA